MQGMRAAVVVALRMPTALLRHGWPSFAGRIVKRSPRSTLDLV